MPYHVGEYFSDEVYGMGAAHATYSDSEILWADGAWSPNLDKPIFDKYNQGYDEMYSGWTHPYNMGWNSAGIRQYYSPTMFNYYSTHWHMTVCSVQKPGKTSLATHNRNLQLITDLVVFHC